MFIHGGSVANRKSQVQTSPEFSKKRGFYLKHISLKIIRAKVTAKTNELGKHQNCII